MSYLADLVHSFTEQELKRFAQLDLVGKEELIRDEFARYARNKNFNEAAILLKHGITKSHFDKVVSILLDKTLTFIAGSELKDKLGFINGKQLSELVLHELKLTEKKLKGTKDKAILKDFYLLAFRTVLLFNFTNYPEKELSYYAEAYTKLLGRHEKEAAYIVKANYEEMVIRYHYHRKDGKNRIARAIRLLMQWEAEVQDTPMYEAASKIYLALSAYYDTKDLPTCMQYIIKADAAARMVYTRISDKDKVFLLAMTAHYMIDLDLFEEGIAKYNEAFSKFPHLITGIFHPYNFAFALLIVKDFDRADAIIKTHIDPFLKNDRARNFRFDILRLHAIRHLLMHETEKAGDGLREILQFSKEDFTLLGDVLFRFVHNVYVLQSGDLLLATSVLKKNLKFIQSKIDIADFSVYKEMFVALGKVIKLKNGIKPVPKPFKAESIWPGKGKSRLYQRLLELPFEQN